MFYPIFAGFMVLVVLYIAVAVVEYGSALGAAGSGRGVLFVAALALLALAVWWAIDAFRHVAPTSAVQIGRAVVFLFAAGPILSDPVRVRLAAGGTSTMQSLGRFRRLIWRPAAILGIFMTVLWFLS